MAARFLMGTGGARAVMALMSATNAATGWVAATAMALASFAGAPPALAGSTNVRVNVSVTVLPSKRQRTLDAEMTLRAADGSAVTLDRRQKLLWLENPQALVRAFAPEANGPVIVTIDM
jgi:hypothetical protein